MNNIQHKTLMVIEELANNTTDLIPSDKIASSVMKKIKADLGEIDEALNRLYDDGYILGTKTAYKLTEKGVFYAWSYEPIDERVSHYINNKYASQLSCLQIAIFFLAVFIAILLFKVFL